MAWIDGDPHGVPNPDASVYAFSQEVRIDLYVMPSSYRKGIQLLTEETEGVNWIVEPSWDQPPGRNFLIHPLTALHLQGNMSRNSVGFLSCQGGEPLETVPRTHFSRIEAVTRYNEHLASFRVGLENLLDHLSRPCATLAVTCRPENRTMDDSANPIICHESTSPATRRR